jgi:hypothetical protein
MPARPAPRKAYMNAGKAACAAVTVSATQPHYSTRIYDQFGVLLRVLSRVQSARYKLAENEVGDFDVYCTVG